MSRLHDRVREKECQATCQRVKYDEWSVSAEAGLPALIEKPPGVNAAEAAELANLSPAPWVGFNRRFEPALVAMRNALPTDKSVELSLCGSGWGGQCGNGMGLSCVEIWGLSNLTSRQEQTYD